MQPDGEVTGDELISEPIIIEMEFDNYVNGACLGGRFQLYDKYGSCVFTTANLHEKDWFRCPYPVGRFISRCVIPANFLNIGRYTVSAIVVRDITRVQAQREEAVSFVVHETGAKTKG